MTISKCLFFSATATSCTLGVTAFGRIATVQRYRDGYVPKVYLAGPFFTLEEPWVVGQARRDLKAMGLDVFSPYHDVGLGTAEDVVKKDFEGLRNCDVHFAIGDGLDSGTISRLVTPEL
ncbi:nucleoside 2-deoxyribosyltransferase [Stutzerimonas stutzeri]|uniref:nucleoside 2-deoxyribosyltransferase n=1 Tax=Stutzerimonas stutzeri TaxID=316 RepID=UPI0024477B3F|nr:nucleoside 2-deoxyribosyltransferase [Stutzerimonas stutzeri]MDH0058349.1 nucleoside 2-deoxyribosyltransferase [Stutzerimonas stutzeri]